MNDFATLRTALEGLGFRHFEPFIALLHPRVVWYGQRGGIWQRPIDISRGPDQIRAHLQDLTRHIRQSAPGAVGIVRVSQGTHGRYLAEVGWYPERRTRWAASGQWVITVKQGRIRRIRT